ncbi:MAG: antibiotic biosynthesis monooxygenase [Actinobacteria bacterium]|nr:antibiotic biosynthesis monooxygenase [Actinomycetota bacterium]MBU1610097.1 antibiotic biosynthesis monooxygenase [Actinomycetota bacterium]MBU2315535.1 antibiotic biosynthesis monooxygenase [Actinomycetota bacterium]MBU2385336.1 antibiotic biosynthesis monooxygenase [Actinomycetota bacterium]
MTSAETVVVTAYFRPRPESRGAVLDALAAAIPRVHDETGCELYAIHDAPDGSIVMIEKWASVADLDAHGDGAPVADLVAALDGLLLEPVAVTRLVPVPVGDPQRGEL